MTMLESILKELVLIRGTVFIRLRIRIIRERLLMWY